MKIYAHGADIHQYNRELIDFSSNINPLGPSPAIIDEIKAFSIRYHDVTRYPDAFYIKLREHLAENMGCSKEQVIVGNGATELIHLFVRAMGFRKWLIPVPAFLEYERAVLLNNGIPVYYYLKEDHDFKLRPGDLIDGLEDVDAVILANPNNPTGTLMDARLLIEFIKYAGKKGKYIMLDEAFIEFVRCYENISMVRYVNTCENLFVIRAATKFYGIPGLRLGYGFACKSIIERLNEYKELWTVNALAQQVGMKLYTESDYIHQTQIYVEKERNFLMKGLTRIDYIQPLPSSANFILCRLKKGNAFALKEKLIDKGILIRDASNFTGLDERYFRIAVKKHEENIMLINALS
ncbi:L-threonine O-3-phosphate decarboxylase [Caldanaerobius fijiensis DSM 17918]|uniref:threonine-phosphate decarboxylase n=1 Tax=Caldanaerobius fijiensis DSM 17918 TaxID=1121256 RepID=A0A1M5DKT0_9THEO|nr:threonine-phosphate decarboxylase CobD [Caldanaerobius fijiensis]SHF67550.1 L-threonine O-3-phosphate decarboxylase [Caldanaerobius fijiensis DSM 17918]